MSDEAKIQYLKYTDHFADPNNKDLVINLEDLIKIQLKYWFI